LHNETQKEKTGFWGYFECENDPEVATLLFDTAADWLRKRGLTRMLGPANPSLNDPCGLLVDGFEWSPFVLMTYNPRYYPTLVTKAGFTKAMDLLAYIIPTRNSTGPASTASPTSSASARRRRSAAWTCRSSSPS